MRSARGYARSGCRSRAAAGIALNAGASGPGTVLGFAIVVGVGVALSGWALLGRRSA